MLDHRSFSQDGSDILDRLKTRGVDEAQITQLKDLVDRRRTAIQELEGKRRELNEATQEVQQKAGVEAPDEKLVDFLSCWFCAPYGVFRIQGKLNEVWEK